MHEFPELLREKLGDAVSLSSKQIAELENHFKLLQHWSRVLNLTAIRDLPMIVERHYCESLFLGSQLPVGPLRIADIGSGAGFPGFPVAVLRPDCSVTLIESHQRKAVFLKEASREMPNIRVLPKRAEQIAQRFDWVISRAVKRGQIPAIAHNGALLTNGPEGIPLPWDPSRFVTMFHVERDSIALWQK